MYRTASYFPVRLSQFYAEDFCHRSHSGRAMHRTGCSLLFFVTLLLPLGVVGTADPPFFICIGRTYATNSTFGHNLQSALASLAANASFFYNATVGKSPDQAVAVEVCRGDLDRETCQVCISDAVSLATQRCPTKGLALIAFQECIMYRRDANSSIPPSIMSLSVAGTKAISDPQRFNPMLMFFFNKLIDSTITNPSGVLFWGDKFKYTHNLTIYGMTQCVQILSPKRCRSCLDIAFGQMYKVAAGTMGTVVYHNSECILRFAAYPIFTPPPHSVSPSTVVSISTNCSPPISSNKVGSPFHRNLKALLSHLIVNTPYSGFYNDTVGTGSGQVYGQALCRGDVLNDVCWECAAQASTKIQELCPNSRRAMVWLDHCQLRYSEENFAGVVDDYYKACQPGADDAPNPVTFYRNLRILTANLSSMVTQSSSDPFFATGISILAEEKRIYALVQCVRDIPGDQCRRCLQDACSDIERCFNGKQGGRILRGSCSLAFGVQPFFSGDPIVVSLPQPIPGHKHWWIYVIISFIGMLLLTTACTFCLVRRRKQQLEKLKQKEATSIDSEGVIDNEATYNLPQISLRTIEDATNKFSEPNKLGEGGYGPVYKGKLPNGQEVAVKRLSGRSHQGLKEFRNEVESMAKLQHTNLVRLIGCCLESGEKMLIYEYVPNKSLDFFLNDPEGRALLDWEKRFNIIIGIARGMLYLHQDSRLNVIHRDLKASNVLLDEQLQPKISDFGLAKIFSGVQGQATTSVIVGTYGYMAPEYAMDGVFSTKSDVYSFGILLLEIISGQMNSASICVIHQGRSLVEHGWSMWCEGKGTEFIDPVLRDATSTKDQMLRCLHIGFLCIQENAASRPTMSTVVLMLGNNSLNLPSPTQPAFIGESAGRSSRRRSSVSKIFDSESTTM